MADQSMPPGRRRPQQPPPSRPRRRREDEEVEQLLELIHTQTDVVADLTRRTGRAERILMEIADCHFENMNPEEKGAIKAVVKEWLRSEGNVERSDVRTERWVRWATIFSGITAGGISTYAIVSAVRDLLSVVHR